MRPAARLQANIELLDEIDRGGAADAASSGYFRRRRYIGSKDRAAIAERLYAMLRRRARLDWWLDRAWKGPGKGSDKSNGRTRMIADLIMVEAWPFRRLAEHFDGEPYSPAPLELDERRLADSLAGKKLDQYEQPRWVKGEYPEWLEAELGALSAPELRALNEPAPLDLRVNTLAATRDEALTRLIQGGLEVAPTSFSPFGLRVVGRPPL